MTARPTITDQFSPRSVRDAGDTKIDKQVRPFPTVFTKSSTLARCFLCGVLGVPSTKSMTLLGFCTA